jgi:ABC-type nitrate/sulfonate/bicarbonate transport system permease component
MKPPDGRQAIEAGPRATPSPPPRQALGDSAAAVGLLGLAGLGLVLGSWEMAARLELINPLVAASPSRVGAALVRQWRNGELAPALGWSAAEFGLGFGLATMIGIAIGLAMGAWRWIEYALDPFVWVLYVTPLVALHPLLVVWIGFGFPVAVTLAFLLAVVPVIANTLAAVRAADPIHVRAVRAFGGGRHAVTMNVVLPASLPLIVAGLRIAAGRALVGVVAGEMFGANAGLGFQMTSYAARLRTADALAPVMLLVLVGVAVTQGLRWTQSRFERWR